MIETEEALKQMDEYPGLISATDEFSSMLHGFEVDLNGDIVIPEFGPAQSVRKYNFKRPKLWRANKCEQMPENKHFKLEL